jgi:adenylate cyclase
MAELVLHNGGILDKYIGDAIMALFGTPFPDPDDADNAVTVAIQMMRALRELNQRRLLEGHQPIEIRLGISTGEVIVGNIGSPRRMDYTVIGHNVNVAARLEGANKFYGTHLIIAESTLSKLNKAYLIRELDRIRVTGAKTPVAIYEVLDGHDPVEYPRSEEMIAAFSQGLGYFRQREWQKAARKFETALGIWPGDQPARLYLTRCARYQHAPPGDDWDGVWSMTQK